MADFYGPWGNPYNTYRVWIRATSSQNKSKNQSTVRVIAYLQDRYGFGYTDSRTRIGISAAGVQKLTTTKRVSFGGAGNRSVEVARASHVVGHTSTGNRAAVRCVATFASQGQNLYNGSASGNLSIPRIPQKPNKPGSAPTVSQTVAGKVTVTSATAGGNGNSITGYQSQRRNYCNGSWSAWGSSQTMSSRKSSFNAGCHGTNYQFRTRAKTSEGWGPWSATRTFATRPRTEPPTISELTPTTAKTAFSRIGRSDGGTTWRIEIADNSSFSGSRVLTTGGTLVVGDLLPGTEYWARSYGTNNTGAGPKSSAVKFQTPPGSAPDVTYSTDLDGRGYEASFSLGGIANAIFTTEWEFVGPGQPPSGGESGSATGSSSTVHVSGLVPGATYRVRGYATVGNYESPKSDWVEITMNTPGGLSGDYFDGNTPNTADLTYEWAGDEDSSVTEVKARSALGWLPVVANPETDEAFAVGYVIDGSNFDGEDYSYRFIVTHDLDGEGLIVGGNNTLDIEIVDIVTYTGSLYATPSVPLTLRAGIAWTDDGGELISLSWGDPREVDSGEVKRLNVNADSPAGAEGAVLLVGGVEGETIEGGTQIDIAGPMMNVGGLTDYFSGNTPDTSRREHVWLGEADESTSERLHISQAFEDPFEDPDCPAPPFPPRPPAIENPCLDDVPLWRRYWVPIRQQDVSAWIDSLPTLTISTGGERAKQVRIRYFENPDELDPRDYEGSDYVSEQLLTSIPANADVVIDGISERVRGRVDGGDWYDIDHLLFGTDGVPPTFPVLGCGVPYLLAIDVPIDSTAGNITVDLDMTNRLG